VALRGTADMDAIVEETAAVLIGRRTFEMGDPDSYLGDYGVPRRVRRPGRR
jgi:hypothetical protein